MTQLRLKLTTPEMSGEPVRTLQEGLARKGWFHDEYDGVYGPLTAQAVFRAKYWLGYAHPDKHAGDLLMAFLDGDRKQTQAMLARTRQRMHPVGEPRLKALAALTGKLGVKESPEGSNIVWASLWYENVSEAWARAHWKPKGPSWCAMAVTWAYVQSGSKAFKRGSRYAYVPYIVHDAHAGVNHLTLTKHPQPGDLACYDWEGDGVADHMGLFEKWTLRSAGEFSAIEGNTAVGNDSNGGEVMRRSRSTGFVQAFVHVGG